MAVLLLIESFTLGLTTIWFAGGALVATIASLFIDNLWVQFFIFIIVSFLLLFFTRPWAIRYIEKGKTKTNYESLVGSVVKITEEVDNINQKGKAFANGTEWTVRSQDAEVVIEAGQIAQVVEVSGVKLIVTPYKEEKN
jgi:membrane protein implicated in regulation of membrane protease activity